MKVTTKPATNKPKGKVGRPRKNPVETEGAVKRGPGIPHKVKAADQPVKAPRTRAAKGQTEVKLDSFSSVSSTVGEQAAINDTANAQLQHLADVANKATQPKVKHQAPMKISIIQDGNFTVAICKCKKDDHFVQSIGFSKYNPHDMKYVTKGPDGKDIIKTNPYSADMGRRTAARRAVKKMLRGEFVTTEIITLPTITNLDEVKI